LQPERLVIGTNFLHVAYNAPPPPIGVILHEELCQLLVKTTTGKRVFIGALLKIMVLAYHST